MTEAKVAETNGSTKENKALTKPQSAKIKADKHKSQDLDSNDTPADNRPELENRQSKPQCFF